MATIIAAAAGNWSAGGTWTGGVVPGDGDTADLNGYVVTMDIATVPASGTLLSLISPSKAGQLTLAMSESNTYAINATTITAGTKTSTGLINVSGAAPAAVLTVTGNINASQSGGTNDCAGLVNSSTGTVNIIGNILGGSGSGGYTCYGCVNSSTGTVNVTGNVTGGSNLNGWGFGNNSTGTVIVTGNITGGSYTNMNYPPYGLSNASTGAVTVTGNITGGSGSGAGLYNWGGVVTLNNCNLINSSTAAAYVGKSPTTWNLNANNYVQWGAVKFYQDVPLAENVTEDDTVAGVTGTYHEATVAEVQNGVFFGAASALTGTYVGGGGRPEFRGGNL